MAFEILLECCCFSAVSKGCVNFNLPRSEGLRAWRLSPVVFGESRFQVSGQPDVVAIRLNLASQDIDVVETHGLLRRSMPILAYGIQSRCDTHIENYTL